MVIENLERLRELVTGKDTVIQVIPSSDSYNSCLNEIVGVHLTTKENTFLVPIDHPEGINQNKNEVLKILENAKRVFVVDKKKTLHYLYLPNSIDILFKSSIRESLSSVLENNHQVWINNKNTSFKEINKLIPLSKLIETYSKPANIYRKVFSSHKDTEEEIFFNNTITPVFFLIEQTGLGIYYKEFIEQYKIQNPQFFIRDSKVYTNYNLYNLTSRPTNSFNTVNFAAIPKKEDYRKCFRPQNDYYVEFDFDSYHIRLLSEQINYSLTSESAHTQLGKQYFKKESLTEEEYLKTKQINFQAIYGNIPRELIDFPLFQKIEEYSKALWSEFQENGFVTSPISGKIFYKDRLDEMNSKKLLNYMIQSLETSRNVLILKEVLGYLKEKKTKIALYTYDSILLDFSKEDGKEVLIEIEKILSEEEKYPVRFKYSKNLVL